MDIKLLVLDVDGTLLNSNREMSERTIKILKKVQQNGVRIALATGRPTYGVLPFAKAIDLDFNDGFIISYNGAKVLEASTGKVIFERICIRSFIERAFLARVEVKRRVNFLLASSEAGAE